MSEEHLKQGNVEESLIQLEQDPDGEEGRVAPFVTIREKVDKLAESLSNLYVREEDDVNEDAGEVNVKDDGQAESSSEESQNETVSHVSIHSQDLSELKRSFKEIEERINNLEKELIACNTSTLHREELLRKKISEQFEATEHFVCDQVNKLEDAVFRCFKRRHKVWQDQLSQTRLTSTPKLTPVNQEQKRRPAVRFKYDSPSSDVACRSFKLPIKINFPSYGGMETLKTL